MICRCMTNKTLGFVMHPKPELTLSLEIASVLQSIIPFSLEFLIKKSQETSFRFDKAVHLIT